MRKLARLGVVLLAGCAHARAAVPAQPVATAEPDLVARSVLAMAEGIEAEGYTLDGAIEQGFLAPAARATRLVSVPAHTCVALVAVATPAVSDLDAGLYAPDGTVLAEDDGSDARPIVRVCTGGEPLSAYLALFAFQGAGSYAVARLTRPAADGDELLGSPETAGSAQFQELVHNLRSRGYQDDGPGTDLPLVAGSALRVANPVAAGQCYSVVADGERLRIRLLDDEGHELARGEGSEGPAAFQYCASESAALTLEVSGQGAARSARVLRLRAAQTAVGGARAVWLGEPIHAAGHEAARAAKSARVCAGAPQPIAARLPLSQGRAHEFTLPAGACERIEAQLHDGLSRATLRVENLRGETLAEADLLATGALDVCDVSAAKQPRRLSVLGRAGYGALTLVRRACAH